MGVNFIYREKVTLFESKDFLEMLGSVVIQRDQSSKVNDTINSTSFKWLKLALLHPEVFTVCRPIRFRCRLQILPIFHWVLKVLLCDVSHILTGFKSPIYTPTALWESNVYVCLLQPAWHESGPGVAPDGALSAIAAVQRHRASVAVSSGIPLLRHGRRSGAGVHTALANKSR